MGFIRPQAYEEQDRMDRVMSLEKRLKGYYTQLMEIKTLAEAIKTEVDADGDSTQDMIDLANTANNFVNGATYTDFTTSLFNNIVN